jgi:hypothetical protein
LTQWEAHAPESVQKCCADPGRENARRSESDYREVVFEREDKDPLRGFMRVDRGMVIVSGYGRHKEARVGSSPPELTARLLLSELENAARREADQKTDGTEKNELYAEVGDGMKG